MIEIYRRKLCEFHKSANERKKILSFFEKVFEILEPM